MFFIILKETGTLQKGGDSTRKSLSLPAKNWWVTAIWVGWDLKSGLSLGGEGKGGKPKGGRKSKLKGRIAPKISRSAMFSKFAAF